MGITDGYTKYLFMNHRCFVFVEDGKPEIQAQDSESGKDQRTIRHKTLVM